MTIAEVDRAVQSANRLIKREAQDKAGYDYILANLIVKGVSILLGEKTTMPSLEDVYGDVVRDVKATEAQQDKVNQQKTELSSLRFKQFAEAYNKAFNAKEVQRSINE